MYDELQGDVLVRVGTAFVLHCVDDAVDVY